MSTCARPELLRFATAEALAEVAASEFVAAIRAALDERGRCRVALAGGSSPRAIYERVAAITAVDGSVDWKRVDVFWGDERCVPPDDEHSNYRMALEAMLERVPIPEVNVHRIQGELTAEEAARAYARTLGEQPLDLVVLGMGDDGHTASLFPGRPEAAERTARVVAAVAPVAPRERVSLTQRAFAEADTVFFWVAGAAKAARLADVWIEIERGDPLLPAARVNPRRCVRWFVDAAAARGLPAEAGSNPGR